MIIEARQNAHDKKHYSHEFVAEADSTMGFHDLPTEIETDIDGGETADDLNDYQTKAEPELQAKKVTRKDSVRENIKGILRNTQAVRIKHCKNLVKTRISFSLCKMRDRKSS